MKKLWDFKLVEDGRDYKMIATPTEDYLPALNKAASDFTNLLYEEQDKHLLECVDTRYLEILKQNIENILNIRKLGK